MQYQLNSVKVKLSQGKSQRTQKTFMGNYGMISKLYLRFFIMITLLPWYMEKQ